MGTPYSRVTVAHGTRTVDLALPSVLPIAEMIPRLLRLCMPDDSGHEPQVWVLARPGEPNLDLGRTLTDAGIQDGEVLELRPRADSPLPAYVEDVRDAVEDAVDESGGQWGSATTLGFTVAAGSIGVAAVALLPEVRQPGDATALALAAAVATALIPALWWVAPRMHTAVAQLLIGVACLWGGLTGWLAASWFTSGPSLWLVAAIGALLSGAALRSITRLATPHLASVTVLVAATAVGAALGDPYDAARALSVVAVIVVGALPRASLTMGGLAAADYRVRNASLLTSASLVRRIRQSSWLLTGAVVAIAALGGVAGAVLAYQPGAWDGSLAAAVGLGLGLRSRVFSRLPQVLPPRVSAIAVLAALALRHGSEVEALLPWFAMIALLSAAVATAVSAIQLSDITRARVKQSLNWLEYVVVITMVALAAGALGVYDAVAIRTG